MVSLNFRVLGTLELVADDITVTHFPTDKTRALLIYLALESGRPHLRRSLSTLLWPEYDERGSLRNLRKGLYYLRQAVGDFSPEVADLLLSVSRQTVALNMDNLTVDAVQFEALLTAVEQHSHRHLHTCESCVAKLAKAGSLYKGELAPGFSLGDAPAFEEWLLFRQEQLQHRAIIAFQHLAAVYEAQDDLKQAEIYATRLLNIDPYNEDVVRQLMRIRAKTGRRGAAQLVYNQLVDTLQMELGVEPEEKTSALFQQIIDNRIIESAAVGSTMHHFPTQFTSFLGRKSELAQMKEMLTNPDFRLVTIVGPGGMGKTRLAIEAAKTAAATQRFSGGIYFANLSAVESAEGLPAALAATLDLVSKTSAPSIEQIVEFLQVRNFLLVLDNFEQVTGGERLVADLIARAPNLTLVVTSRQLLHLKAERVIRLSGLAYPEEGIYHPEAGNLSSIMSYDAVRLFVQSARSVKPDFALTTNNIEPVVRITSLAQGMPLALEIAASWVRVMKAETIAETIERSLEFLTSPMHDLPERHQSMTAVFDHSWKLLTSGEQKTLAQLSVFRGSFTLETALTVADTTINKIAALLDKSLLQSPTSGRYMLHEFLRQYMLAKFSELAAGSELESTTRRKHSDHYMNLVAGSVNDFFGSEPQTAAKRLRRRLGNITQAWDWAIEHCDEAPRIDALMCSIEGLVRFYDFLGLAGEGERIIGNALTVVEAKAAAGGLPEESFAKLSGCLLMWKALFLNRLGQIDNGIQTAEEALKRGDPDSSILVQAKSLLGRMLPDTGQFDRAEAYQEEALSYFEAVGDRRSAALAVGRLGVTRWRRGSYSKAIENLKKALGLQEALGDLGAAAELNRSIAGIYYEHQDYTNARLYVERAQREYKELGDVIGVARTNGNLALLFQKNAQYELALEFNQKEIDHYQETGVLRSVEITLGNRGGIYMQMGAVDKAITTYQEALRLSRKLGLVWNQARNMAALASIWHELGDYQQAEAMYEEAIPILREHGAVYYYLQPLIGQAKTFLMQGRLDEAGEVIAESLRLSEQTDIKEWFFELQTVVIRLKNKRGDDDDARQQISEMLAATRDPAEIAGLHYELWRINGEEEEAQAAYDLYRQLNEKLPHYDYQRRLATLETAVSY